MMIFVVFKPLKCHLPFPGVFIASAKDDSMVTKNLVPGESVYGEKRIQVESDAVTKAADGTEQKPEKIEHLVIA